MGEEFYQFSINLDYENAELNQAWSDSILDHICEKSFVSVERIDTNPLEMRLAMSEFGICAVQNSPSIKLYVYTTA